MKKRDLSAEEQAAWEEALHAARPLRGKIPAASSNTDSAREEELIYLSRVSLGGDATHPSRICKGNSENHNKKTSDIVQSPVTRDDFRTLDKTTAAMFRGGKLPIDARLDLHGLKASEAHHRTHHFISSAVARGDRTLLIITGKGKRGEGIIRRELPHWLEAPALRPFILAMTYARPEEGGEGAYRILLRRQKE